MGDNFINIFDTKNDVLIAIITFEEREFIQNNNNTHNKPQIIYVPKIKLMVKSLWKIKDESFIDKIDRINENLYNDSLKEFVSNLFNYNTFKKCKYFVENYIVNILEKENN